jgi:hypothetical protein
MRRLSSGRVARVEGPSRRCHQWPSANGRSHSDCRSWRSWERTARRSGDKLTLHTFIGAAPHDFRSSETFPDEAGAKSVSNCGR